MGVPGYFIAVLGLSNGMIGGTILVIPLIGIKTGYVMIPLISIFFGSISAYTAYLIMHHLGQCKNIRQSILQHFNNKHYSTVLYNFIIGLSLLGILVNYFQLIIMQIEGFIQPSPFIGLFVFLFLIFMTFLMRILHFGEKLLALGILSIVGYCTFLVWAQVTAPGGTKRIPPVGPAGFDLAASLMMGYAIHDFVAQVLLNTTTPNYYNKSIIFTYFIGICAYTFITYGCFAVINREPRVDDPQTISEYFAYDGWQVQFIQIIYFFHLITASPEFCIILRIRWLQMFKLQPTDKITIPQVLIYLFTYGVTYFFYASGIKIATIIQINGSIIGVLYIFLIPIVVHLKCVYFSKHNQQGMMISEQYDQQTAKTIQYLGNCQCKLQYKNKYTKFAQLVFLIFILILGAITIYFTIKNLFFKTQETEIISSQNQETIAEHLSGWPMSDFLL